MNTDRAILLQRLDRILSRGGSGTRIVHTDTLKAMRAQIEHDAKYERIQKAMEAAE